MDSTHTILPFAIALFIGALIGLEREKRKLDGGQSGIGGIRTFTLFAMSGAIGAWLTVQTGIGWIFLVTALCVTAIVIVGGTAHAIQHPESRGLTTEIAALVTFLLGATALFGHEQLAVALAIATSALLAYKQPLHQLVKRLDQDDLYAALKLLIATFILLPVFPNRTIDPWDALNPYKIWLIVILISAMSFIGYLASRWLGERRAIPLTGLFGGIVSSTAVSLAFSKQSRASPAQSGLADALASGLLLAWTVMFARVLIIVAVVNRGLLPILWPSMAAMGLVTAIFGLVYFRQSGRGQDATGSLHVKNPFSLMAAVPFALLFAVILLAVKGVEGGMHGHGLNILAAVAGLTDVDAITLSMAELGRDPLRDSAAATGIFIAASANTIFKCGLVVSLGSSALRNRALIATAGILAAGFAAAFIK